MPRLPPPAALVARADGKLGDVIEAAVLAKHRRRLVAHGRLPCLEPGPGWWAAGEPEPREGCELRVLIDGDEAFGAIAAAIRSATRSVWVAGWHIAPDFELLRGEEDGSAGALLAEAAERVDVRVLMWAGSPVPLFHPTRAETRRAREALTRRTRVRVETDPREHPFHCHHEKLVIVDGEIAFVGGLDMTNLAGDRWDSSRHPARRRLGWHDVGTRLRGPAVADVAAHFSLRWWELTGERLTPVTPPPPLGGHTVQVVRTVAEGMYDRVPDGDFRILESYRRAIRGAERFIYLENQFLWAPEITRALVEKLRHPPRSDFRLVIVLPTRANNGQDDTLGQVAVLKDADDGDRLLVATLRSLSGEREDRLYVHAKVGIVDDRWLTVGSANLNAHSLFNDTEMNVVCDDPALARDTRLRLWAEHLDVPVAALSGREPSAVVDELWRPIALDELARMRRGAPPRHHLLAMPGVSRRSRRVLGPLNGLITDG
ncbi:phosphatidylserine/phosphatidylglycerophosphate/cardiolipin synthase family protein [Conexibacter sp. DBS9H8]|uniref:phospholipase D-like domain-containing protein n=1 Tax=Conexibacter sp. DBS9H8 TaxID=2937801 RepID=UPI00201032F7|nr:phospholipase D family protein [Conexibacter sp. DBS9H8]